MPRTKHSVSLCYQEALYNSFIRTNTSLKCKVFWPVNTDINIFFKLLPEMKIETKRLLLRLKCCHRTYITCHLIAVNQMLIFEICGRTVMPFVVKFCLFISVIYWRMLFYWFISRKGSCSFSMFAFNEVCEVVDRVCSSAYYVLPRERLSSVQTHMTKDIWQETDRNLLTHETTSSTGNISACRPASPLIQDYGLKDKLGLEPVLHLFQMR